jgi:hypothetical protein
MCMGALTDQQLCPLLVYRARGDLLHASRKCEPACMFVLVSSDPLTSRSIQVQVNDPHISASHLVIEVVDEDSEGGPRAWLDDKSTNGAFHNGTKIGKGNKVMAVSGDLVSFVVAPTRRHDGSYFVEDKDLVSAGNAAPCTCLVSCVRRGRRELAHACCNVHIHLFMQ